jgi:hypothetical protein
MSLIRAINRETLESDFLSASGFVLEPHIITSPIVPVFFGAVWNRSNLAITKRPAVIGSVDLSSINTSPWRFDIGTFVIKEPGSNQFFIPDELEPFVPFVQKCINNEFSANKRALHRRAFLIVHSSRTEIGKSYRPHAEGLHGHPPLVSGHRNPVDLSNPHGVENTHYYGLTNRNPTGFYTGAINLRDIDEGGFKIKSNKYTCDYQPEAGDISLFTSVHAHQSPCENEKNSLPRIFANVIFEDPNANGETRRTNNMYGQVRTLNMSGRRADAEALVLSWRAKTVQKFDI